MNSDAELLIVPPRAQPDVADEFVAKCVIEGVHFYIEADDGLPTSVPPGLKKLRAIVIEQDEAAANAAALSQYEAAGVCIYRMNRAVQGSVPNTTLVWTSIRTFHCIVFDALLTLNNPSMRAFMQSRDEAVLLDAMGEKILASEAVRWYDATRYQWDAMLGAHRVTGDRRYLDTAERQMRNAIANVPNHLGDCDCVAPLIPMLRLQAITGDAQLLDYSVRMFDQYIKATPRCEGVFVNFASYPNTVRSEILFQVLPGLAMLHRATGDRRYLDLLVDQFQRLHRLLFDRKARLWSHGARSGRGSGGFWARGVALGLCGTLGVLEYLDEQVSAHELVRETFVANAERLRELQDDKIGFWFAIPDNEMSGRESSGTAWICSALHRALERGFLPEDFSACAERAWGAVKTRIFQGGYPGHMAGTTVSLQPEYYLRQPLVEKGWTHFALQAMVDHRSLASRKLSEV